MITASKFVYLGFLFIGVFVLMQVALPLLSFQIWSLGQKYNNADLNSPVNSDKQVLGISISNKDNFSQFISNKKREGMPPYSQFILTVPRINLKDVTVYVDSNDASKGLAQLPGSALPGEKGNLFISGHSALNNFWVKDAFFAKLMDVKVGDTVEVEASGTKFVYQIINIKAVDPTDVSVINPPDDSGRYVTLMTCVPPGLNFKRLIVLGKMI